MSTLIVPTTKAKKKPSPRPDSTRLISCSSTTPAFPHLGHNPRSGPRSAVRHGARRHYRPRGAPGDGAQTPEEAAALPLGGGAAVATPQDGVKRSRPRGLRPPPPPLRKDKRQRGGRGRPRRHNNGAAPVRLWRGGSARTCGCLMP